MTWTQTYWDLLDHLYWAPQYLGLKSIPRKHWSVDGDRVSIPCEMTSPNGPLYYRLRRFGTDYRTYARRQEETFNHIFDIAFAVLPGDAIAELLNPFTQAGSSHNYEALGKTLWSRYGFGENSNVTVPDGFFVAERSVLAVELKFNAKTSLDQLAKYVMLFAAEEQHAGARPHLDLLYVFNCEPIPAFEEQVGLHPGAISDELFEPLLRSVKNHVVRALFRDKEDAIRGTLRRIRVHCISWGSLVEALEAFSGSLGSAKGTGDRTLKRLIDGLVHEIRQHPRSNVQSSPAQA
jgi:hypothetical protein